MAINQNHLFEEVGGVKCAVVEKNVLPERVVFLRDILEVNGYEVHTAPTPPPKVPVTTPDEPFTPSTFTVGVTDLMFNPVNAIFGRLLRTGDGKIVTLGYWQQKEQTPNEDVPYFETNNK